MDPKIYKQSTSLMMKTTYLYYEEGYSQSEIAKHFGISVSTVSRLLNNAKKENMISFVINDKVMEVVALEEKLKEKFNLEEVIIARWMEEEYAPTKDDLKKLVAIEGAQYIQRVIEDNDILGITFGKTMYHTINSFNPCKKTDTQFLTLHGTLPKIDKTFNADYIVERMAMSFGGINQFIKANGYAKTEYEANMLINRVDNSKIFEKYKKVDIAVSGIGSFYPHEDSYLVTAGCLSEEQTNELRESGVYADIGLRFIDKDGNECNTSLKKKSIGISYEDFKSIPRKVIMVSGEYKKHSLKAALNGGLIDVLVLDYDLAKAISEM